MKAGTESLDKIINESLDAREVKRALSVKLVKTGEKPSKVSEWLNVSEAYISKWKGRYEEGGAEELRMGYEGDAGYLSQEQRGEVLDWIKRLERVSVEQVRDYIEEKYQVVYRSKQSYYELLEAGGMSYHKSEKVNPKHNAEKVLEKRAELKKNWQNEKMRLSEERWLCYWKMSATYSGVMPVG
jgi:putative transposase